MAALNPALAAATLAVSVWRKLMNSLIWQSVMWRPGKVPFLISVKNCYLLGRPRPPANAPLSAPRHSPDSQRQSGYALLPSRTRRYFLILIDARLASRSPRHSVSDFVTRDLFVAILTSEEAHVDFLETQLGLLAKIGPENYIQLQSGPAS